ncbi:heparinase II/III family protein [Paenibacillus sp. J5C_2022]|uniref:heparinase II/III family protein n=1 Tax=Paenibacillus sp. J5C2022 TaxID=2977129 RepID=UPI0021D0EE8E|nr:heparinase II/III family protein [Paenibacillus sp. J5C2022]MCU6711857.1 heparinase II/III family protein [Paenibacillus sp. J5C2022]
MRSIKITVSLLMMMVLIGMPARAFAYEYRYEARLAALDVYPHSNLEAGPIVSEDEFYGKLLDPTYNAEIADIVETYQSGDAQGAKEKWHHYIVNRDDRLLMLSDLKSPDQLTAGDINYSSANRGLNRGHIRSGYEYYFPDEIDWNYNPTYYDEEVPLDNGWLWTLHNHASWMSMAMASLLQDGNEYGEELADQMKSWIATQIPGVRSVGYDFHDANKSFVNYNSVPGGLIRDEEDPFSYGYRDDNGSQMIGTSASWRTIEVGVRLQKWVETIYYFKHSEWYDAELNDLLTRSLVDQATWLAFPHHYTEGSNWGSYEAGGMLYTATYFPEITVQQEMAELAAKRLTRAIDGQVLPDGALNELSPTYHISVLNRYTAFIKGVRDGKLRGETWEQLEESIERQYSAFLAITAPNGGMPTGNEATLSKFAGSSLREIFANALDIFPEREDFRWVATGGAEGQRPDFDFYHLRNAGNITMRSGWELNDDYLHFTAGPTGSTGWHSFQNKLDVQLYSNGYPLLVNAGKHLYDKSAARWYVTNTRGSNSALVDGYGQARRTSTPMNILRRLADYFYYDGEGVSFASATYDKPYGTAGYGSILETADVEVEHTRSVIYLKDAYAVLIDDFKALDQQEHQYELLFHTPVGYYQQNSPSVTAEAVELADGMHWSIGSAEAVMKGISAAPFDSAIVEGLNPGNVDLGAELNGTGREKEMRGWLEHNTPTPTQQYTVNGTDVRFFTVISPMSQPDQLALELDNGGKDLVIVFEDGSRHQISLDDAGDAPSVEIQRGDHTIAFTAKSNLAEQVLSIASMREALNRYKTSGDLHDPLHQQLGNRLDQAEHHRQGERTKQAIKHMEDFLRHLTNNGLQHLVTEEVREELAQDAQILIEEWKEE